MAFNEDFGSGLGNYEIYFSGGPADTGEWDAGNGNTSAGCVKLEWTNQPSTVDDGVLLNQVDTHTIASGDYLYFNYRVVGFNYTSGGMITIEGRQGPSLIINTFIPAATDSGWHQFGYSIAGLGSYVDTLAITAQPSFNDQTNAYTVYIDSVRLGPTPPAITAESAIADQMRLLGLAADSGFLYLTGIADGTIRYFKTTQDGLQVGNSDAFGAAGYTDPDTFTRGLLPVVRPGADGVVIVFGRDGSNRQVLRNDLNGTLGWVDVGAGTATWGTAKYCVALMPDQGRPDDVIAAFSDNDVYRTETGTAAWTKQGDASSNLRTGARHPTAPEGIWLAGTAAGTLLYSGNMGVSFSSVGGTAVTGTINAIEVSR